MTPHTNPVFHYTRSLDQIISNGYLILNPHHDLNNKGNEELVTGVRIIKDQLASFNNKKLEDTFEQYIEKGLTIYTSSFCQEKDSQHMMIEYGKDQLEFQAEFLNSYSIINHLIFGSVKYDANDQVDIIKHMFSDYEKLQNTSAFPMEDLLIWLTIVIPLFKDAKYNNESECRVIGTEIRDKNGKLWTQESCKKILFHGSDVAIHRYNLTST